MKNIRLVPLMIILFCIIGCSSTKTAKTSEKSLQEELNQKNIVNMTLLQRLQQKPGVMVRNGVPIIQKAANSQSGFSNLEPLYILDGQNMGSSFNSVNDVVTSVMVEKIEVLFGSRAASYGAQGSKGVIKITTFK